MKGSIKLGKVAGIGIFLHWTFAILIAYIVFTNAREGRSSIEIAWAVAFVLAVFVTVVLHELGHSLAAKKYGIHTRNITLLPIGGVAQLDRIPEKPREELVVAAAGPAVNLVIALVCGIILGTGDFMQSAEELTSQVNGNNFLLNFFVVNLWLVLFNLIPAFPMDGGRMLRALLAFKMERSKATRIAARIGQVLAIGFIIIGFQANPFLILIGIFIFLGAQSEAQFTQSKSLLVGFRVEHAVMRDFQALSPDDTLQAAVSHLLNGPHKTFVVMQEGRPVGILTREVMIRAISSAGINQQVGQVMDTQLQFIDANTSLEEAYQAIATRKNVFMLVLQSGQFIGTLDPENILEFVMVRQAVKAV